ncbi:hypothetical protein HYH03_012534 [Edaphochlamys debaryana]|uniref:RCK N-terminal domain-containing protein n=1 Tax=Edaphochlamys debaryana TaxID=47281 RepID=A0A836BVD7_9CHLO|nr:hypothetical protein HYH03_012534 [Edaphochlamys debaryana]|eukprot:KAG2488904.1 hypothetical protein HYH03_012534 [Edaphochlamys debaryana]
MRPAMALRRGASSTKAWPRGLGAARLLQTRLLQPRLPPCRASAPDQDDGVSSSVTTGSNGGWGSAIPPAQRRNLLSPRRQLPLWDEILYMYYNWRQDAGHDLLLAALLFLGLVLSGALVKGVVLEGGEDGESWWINLYEVMKFSLGQDLPPSSPPSPVRQAFSVGIASVGLAAFALVLALVEQVVFEVFEGNVRQGSAVYEEGHVLVLAWCKGQRDFEVLTKLLYQLCQAYRSDGGTVVVVMSERPKLEMEATFRRTLPEPQRLGSRFVFRHGSPLVPDDLRRVAAADAATTVILADSQRNPDEADAQSVRCAILLDELEPSRFSSTASTTTNGNGNGNGSNGGSALKAITDALGFNVAGGGAANGNNGNGGSAYGNGGGRRAQAGPTARPRSRIVVQLLTSNALAMLYYACSSRAVAVPTSQLNARRVAKILQHPVVSVISQQIMSFETPASCLYVQTFPELSGLEFGEIAFRFDSAIVLGVSDRVTRKATLNPPVTHRLSPDEDLVLLRPTDVSYPGFRPFSEPLPGTPPPELEPYQPAAPSFCALPFRSRTAAPAVQEDTAVERTSASPPLLGLAAALGAAAAALDEGGGAASASSNAATAANLPTAAARNGGGAATGRRSLDDDLSSMTEAAALAAPPSSSAGGGGGGRRRAPPPVLARGTLELLLNAQPPQRPRKPTRKKSSAVATAGGGTGGGAASGGSTGGSVGSMSDSEIIACAAPAGSIRLPPPDPAVRTPPSYPGPAPKPKQPAFTPAFPEDAAAVPLACSAPAVHPADVSVEACPAPFSPSPDTESVEAAVAAASSRSGSGSVVAAAAASSSSSTLPASSAKAEEPAAAAAAPAGDLFNSSVPLATIIANMANGIFVSPTASTDIEPLTAVAGGGGAISPPTAPGSTAASPAETDAEPYDSAVQRSGTTSAGTVAGANVYGSVSEFEGSDDEYPPRPEPALSSGVGATSLAGVAGARGGSVDLGLIDAAPTASSQPPTAGVSYGESLMDDGTLAAMGNLWDDGRVAAVAAALRGTAAPASVTRGRGGRRQNRGGKGSAAGTAGSGSGSTGGGGGAAGGLGSGGGSGFGSAALEASVAAAAAADAMAASPPAPQRPFSPGDPASGPALYGEPSGRTVANFTYNGNGNGNGRNGGNGNGSGSTASGAMLSSMFGSMGSSMDAAHPTLQYLVPMEYLAAGDGSAERVLLCGWADERYMGALLRELDHGSAALPPGSELLLMNTHDTSATLDVVLQSVKLANITVRHLKADPLQRSEMAAHVDVTQLKAALVLCDERWVDPDLDQTNGVDSLCQADMLRLDSLVMMVQLNIRKLLEDASRPTINIVCQKVSSIGMTRFEDRRRLPLGININFASYAAKLLTMCAVNPSSVAAYAAFGGRTDMTVADAADLAGPGERLSFVQLQRRAQSNHQILVGYYQLPTSIDEPLTTVINPRGLRARTAPRVWNRNGNCLTKFILLRQRPAAKAAAPPADTAATAAAASASGWAGYAATATATAAAEAAEAAALAATTEADTDDGEELREEALALARELTSAQAVAAATLAGPAATGLAAAAGGGGYGTGGAAALPMALAAVSFERSDRIADRIFDRTGAGLPSGRTGPGSGTGRDGLPPALASGSWAGPRGVDGPRGGFSGGVGAPAEDGAEGVAAALGDSDDDLESLLDRPHAPAMWVSAREGAVTPTCDDPAVVAAILEARRAALGLGLESGGSLGGLSEEYDIDDSSPLMAPPPIGPGPGSGSGPVQGVGPTAGAGAGAASAAATAGPGPGPGKAQTGPAGPAAVVGSAVAAAGSAMAALFRGDAAAAAAEEAELKRARAAVRRARIAAREIDSAEEEARRRAVEDQRDDGLWSR